MREYVPLRIREKGQCLRYTARDKGNNDSQLLIGSDWLTFRVIVYMRLVHRGKSTILSITARARHSSIDNLAMIATHTLGRVSTSNKRLRQRRSMAGHGGGRKSTRGGVGNGRNSGHARWTQTRGAPWQRLLPHLHR